MELKTAILVDGSYFVNRTNYFKRKYFSEQGDLTALHYIGILQGIIRRHLSSEGAKNHSQYYLYRTFYYDSPPLDLRIHKPFCEEGETNKRIQDFSTLPENRCRKELLKGLQTQRKVALRLGTIKHQKKWKLKDRTVQDLLKGELSIDELGNSNFYFDSQQKGVDIKLGLDIATLAYEKLVDQIILIAGDSDFVSAAKLARMKGIDFVLDSLRGNIDPSLNEHIDGLNSFDLVSIISKVIGSQPDVKPTWWDDVKPENSVTKPNKKRIG